LAIKPKENEAFYREVDEELRREQMATVWKRYGRLIIGGIVLFLALIAGIIYWNNRQQAKAGEHGEQLSQIFEDVEAKRLADVPKRLDALAEEGSDGYRAAALLTKAAIAVDSGDDAGAVAIYRQVAADDSVAAPYRDLALVRQTAVEFDRIPPAAVVERLRPLAVAGNPWFGSAGEMVALAHLKQNKPELAGPIFAAIAKDQTLPESIRSRAVQMAGSLGIDAIQTAEGPNASANTKATQ
jgi:hypothetical protein